VNGPVNQPNEKIKLFLLLLWYVEVLCKVWKNSTINWQRYFIPAGVINKLPDIFLINQP
jgi:hypothetical protein